MTLFTQTLLVVKTDPPLDGHGNSLRGFVARLFPEQELTHNHAGSEFLYLYPRIQYRVLDQAGLILGIDEGAEAVEEFSSALKELEINGVVYRVSEKQLTVSEVEYGICDSTRKYQFIRPWLALNERNHQKYRDLESFPEKRRFLENILNGNILSMSKSLGYVVEGRINTEFREIRQVETHFKGIAMTGFTGEFSVNFKIPDYWGLGKSVSRGFGTLVGCCA
ncbi:MAG: CRISPR-associated endonuclease Cas6 [Candidatus Wallbacteria bacterium]|nr:CRISPR-associated endonuclease Cas6 [Candidatus Wallbacteria bacterium]